MGNDKKQPTITESEKKTDIRHALMNLLNSSTSGGNQYVTFAIGNELYGLDITLVQEITAYRSLTYLPNTPKYVKGILNLRGHVIPVMDPRLRFELPTGEYDSNSVIIIFKTQQKTMGMIVDKIQDVITIDQENIEDTPEMAINIHSNFIKGVGKVDHNFVIILDCQKVFSTEELAAA